MKRLFAKHRILSFIVTLAIIFSVVPISAAAEDNDIGTGALGASGCVCEALCGEDSVNADCPVCAGDYEQCTYTNASVASPGTTGNGGGGLILDGGEESCVCTAFCDDPDCPVCKDDATQCAFYYCVCEALCGGDSVNPDCPVCKDDYTKCAQAVTPPLSAPYTADGDGSQGDPVKTYTGLLAAVTAANSGTITEIYIDAVTIEITTALPNITKTLTIIGAGQSSTVLTVGGNFRHFVLDGTANTTLTLKNMTLQGRNSNNDNTTGGGVESPGGAVGRNLVMESCTVTDCYFTGDGGGVVGKASVTMTNCTVTNNTSTYGGGVYASTATLTNCAITDNTATNTGGGVRASTATLTNCTITGNTAGQTAGGVYYSTLTIIDSSGGKTTITGNKKGTADNNVHLDNGIYITLPGALDGATRIGVTTATAPTDGNPVIITDGGSPAEDNFFSDNDEDYETVLNGGVIKLQVKSAAPTTVILGAGSYGTAGDKQITGLASNAKHVVYDGESWYAPTSSGLGDAKASLDAAIEAATVLGTTTLTGLTNGKTYTVYFINTPTSDSDGFTCNAVTNISGLSYTTYTIFAGDLPQTYIIYTGVANDAAITSTTIADGQTFGSTAKSYTLSSTTADGSTIAAVQGEKHVTITVGGTDFRTTITVTEVAANAAPTATAVNANATAPVVGTAITGTYTYNAGTGTGVGAESGTTFKWYRGDTNSWATANPQAISGATGISYTPTGADVGKYLYFEVTPSNGTLAGTATQSAASGQAGIMVSLTVTANSTTGTATIDSGTEPVKVVSTASPVVAATLGDAASVAWTATAGTFTNAAIASPTYALPTLNTSVTQPITITATFTAVANAAPTATAVNANATAPVVGTAITGTYTYNAGTGTGAGAESGTTFKWYRGDTDSWATANPQAISGATSSTYTPTGADVGKYLYFEVTPSNGTLAGTAVQSTASGQAGIMVSLTVTANSTTGTATIDSGTGPVKVVSTASPVVAATLGDAASVAWTATAGTFTNAASASPTYALPTLNTSVTAPITITATFTAAAPTYTATLTVNKDGNPYTGHGKTFYLKQGASSYTGTGADGTVTFSAVPAGTYSLYDGTADTGASVTVSGATGATINYYTVTFNATDAGNASGSTISAAYNGSAIISGAVVLGGKTLTLTATGAGATTYTYAWGGTASGTSATYTTTVSAAVNATCTVTGTGTAAITGISVKSQPAKLTYTEGQTLDLTGLAVTLSLSNSTTQDVSYTDFGTYGVSMSYTGGGAAAHGDMLTATAHNGKTITLTCNSHTAQTSALTVNAAAVQHTITASAGTGGSISPSGSVTVNNGGSQIFTITASSGYAISSVTVDGASVGAVGSYTFSNVTGNHTIHATFYSTGGGSTSSGGGSSSGGSSSDSGNSGGTTSSTPQVTSLGDKPSTTLNDAIDKAADALAEAAAAAGSGTDTGSSPLDVKLKNVSEITPKNVAEIIKKAKELGTKARLSSDTISENGRAVEVRVTVDPEQITETVKLDGYVRQSETRAAANTFDKYFENETAAISLGQEGAFGQTAKVAAKLDLTNFDTENIYIYRYDRQTNTYHLIDTPYRIDVNGYLHFYTDHGGDIIVSNGPLTKRGDIQQSSDGTMYYIASANLSMITPNNAIADAPAKINAVADTPATVNNTDTDIPAQIRVGEAITPMLSKNSPITGGAEAALMVSPALNSTPESPKSGGGISAVMAVVMAVSILLSAMMLWALIPRKDDPIVSVEEYRKNH